MAGEIFTLRKMIRLRAAETRARQALGNDEFKEWWQAAQQSTAQQTTRHAALCSNNKLGIVFIQTNTQAPIGSDNVALQHFALRYSALQYFALRRILGGGGKTISTPLSKMNHYTQQSGTITLCLTDSGTQYDEFHGSFWHWRRCQKISIHRETSRFIRLRWVSRSATSSQMSFRLQTWVTRNSWKNFCRNLSSGTQCSLFMLQSTFQVSNAVLNSFWTLLMIKIFLHRRAAVQESGLWWSRVNDLLWK